MNIPRHVLASILLASAVAPAHAADAVTDALTAAYAPYRAALFRTNSKAQAESEQAIAQAQQALRRVIEQHAAKPAPPYDRDPTFAATLDKIGAVYAKAAGEIRDGKLPDAHETLKEARDLMADLRRRNGVVTFSDAMNAYHAQMEHVLTEGPKRVDAPADRLKLVADVGALDYLAARLRADAPAALAKDAEFDAALKAVEAAVAALRDASLAQNPSAIKEALGKLKQPYSKLFLRWG
jgi:hypothetical protein